MRFLVLGAGGMAGHVISIYLQERGHGVVGFARRPLKFVETVTGDVTDISLLEEVLWDDDFDVVINAVGILNKNAEENANLAMAINGQLPHKLALITKHMRTRVFHMSTDCVFAGNSAPYSERSIPDGRSVYDKTKALGELNDSINLTFRNSIVGPDINPEGIGLFNWFMKQKGPIDGYTKAMWTGLTTIELAKAMEHMALCDAVGLVNMVPKQNISKYRLLVLFNHYFKDDKLQIIPSDKLSLDKTLIRTNHYGGFIPKSYEEQIREMAEWVRAHENLYPHYGVKTQ